MTIENYPRPNQRIAPKMLREYLPARLRDLDESAWQRFTPQECEAFGAMVIRCASEAVSAIRSELGARKLPPLPPTVRLHQLPLQVRTMNCLVMLGLDEDFSVYKRLTIGKLLATRNFGVKSLVDLLVTLETVAEMGTDAPLGDDEQLEDASGALTASEFVLTAQDIEAVIGYCHAGQLPPPMLCGKVFPPIPAKLDLRSLDLRVRTYNALNLAGFVEAPQELGGRTLQELLSLKNFGKDSLLDLLTRLAPLISNSPEAQQSRDNALERLREEASLLEAMPGADEITVHDVRLGAIMRRISVAAADAQEAAEQILADPEAVARPSQTVAAIIELRERVAALSDMKLEEEFASFVAQVSNNRNAEIYIRRNGLDGAPEQTLEATAQSYGMTRERVRQICSAIIRRSGEMKPFMPRLDAALDFIAANAPCVADEISGKLRTHGFSVVAFDLGSISNAARLFRREVPFAFAEASARRIAIPAGGDYAAGKIVSTARRRIRQWGAATLADASAEAAAAASLPEEVARSIIRSRADFEWLDEERDWFWLKSVPRNRVINRMAKVMRVAPVISIAELRDGVRRHYRMEGYAPPRRVLTEMCKRLSWCQIIGEDGTVTATAIPERLGVLSDMETLMMEILQTHDSIMRRDDFERVCLARGMNRATFFVYLDYSPIIIRHMRGVYGLRGATVAPGVAESLAPKIKRTKVLQDYGWLPDGKLWVGYKLSESVVTNGVCGIPASLAEHVQGEFGMNDQDGVFINTFTARNSSAWGFGAFLRRRGGEAGDTFVMVFDLQARTVTPHIGDDSLLDEFQQPDVEKGLLLTSVPPNDLAAL